MPAGEGRKSKREVVWRTARTVPCLGRAWVWEISYHLWDLRPPQPGTRHMEPIWQKSPISVCPRFWMPDLRHPAFSLWRSRVTTTPLVFMLLHNRSRLFMAASQSQRRKAHCSALVARACRDMVAGTLSLSAVTNSVCQCCRQPLAGC